MALLSRMRMTGQADTATAEADVEAHQPFDCEHVVPRSWFAKAEPMRGDLHHLFACESRCNSFRGNTPFAEFPDFPTTPPPEAAMSAVRTDCGKSAENGFEPANGKGAAARGVLLPAALPRTHLSRGDAPERWEVMVTWHERDPVTTWELHRNAAIFERQGNRNPFIDHPEWVPQIAARPPR